jgi:carbon starvation protein CstA
MASPALLLITLWLMSKAKSYQWTFGPFIFMFVTTVAALLWSAYAAFFINLPKQTTWQGTVAQVTIGVLALILIALAVILVADGIGSLQRARAKKPAEA